MTRRNEEKVALHQRPDRQFHSSPETHVTIVAEWFRRYCEALPCRYGTRHRYQPGSFDVLYWYGIGLGLRSVVRGKLSKKVLRQFVEPVHYWRCLEYGLAGSDLQFTAEDRVLDVGSPKLLSLYLADRIGCEVVATDISDYFVTACRDFAQSLGVSSSRYITDVVDGRALPYEDCSFTKIYALSVVEHIPAEGDIACLRHIGRCLAPGGRALVTVPGAEAGLAGVTSAARGPDHARETVTSEVEASSRL
ncbi:MAG: class I SAM-dependent methyltransferase [Actinobacteria bacterium]|nr:class I SAM-dependent methyltransferase [Actinomycetota bacterium]